MQHDVDLFALANAAKWIDLYYTERPLPRHVYLLCRNSSALTAIANIRASVAQPHNTLFHNSLTSFCSRHKDTGITVTIPPTRRQKTARFEGSAKRQDGNPRVEAFKLRCRALKRQKNEEKFKEFRNKCHAYKRQKMAEDSEDDMLVIAHMVSATNNEIMRHAGLQTAIRWRHVGERVGTTVT